METEHEEGVVERVVTYLKDLVGAPPADKPVVGPDVIGGLDAEAPSTSTELMQKYPEQGVPESALDQNAHSARLEDGE